MIIDDKKLKRDDQIIYRGYVAIYEGDLLGSFTLAHEDSLEDVICFPTSIDEIIYDVNAEYGSIGIGERYEIIIF